jgi:hypothetical protein
MVLFPIDVTDRNVDDEIERHGRVPDVEVNWQEWMMRNDLLAKVDDTVNGASLEILVPLISTSHLCLRPYVLPTPPKRSYLLRWCGAQW